MPAKVVQRKCGDFGQEKPENQFLKSVGTMVILKSLLKHASWSSTTLYITYTFSLSNFFFFNKIAMYVFASFELIARNM